MRLKVLASLSAAGGSALAALWTFPTLLASAFLVAWGAEAAQFLISQGLALAVLAWLQTAPEFAVEAVIAWDAGREPARAQLAIANLTGAIRLLLGFGWPLVYGVYAVASRRRGGPALPTITLQREHAVEVLALIPVLLYFGIILAKGSFGAVDAGVLTAMYGGYLWLLAGHPPHAVEQAADAPAVSRWALRQQPGWRRRAAIGGLFAAGGALLFVTAHPFLESMLAVAAILGIGEFFLVQWVAPFLSEFPEMVSTVAWARRVKPAPLALMNLVSSNINQWTVLAAMIPLVFGYSAAARDTRVRGAGGRVAVPAVARPVPAPRLARRGGVGLWRVDGRARDPVRHPAAAATRAGGVPRDDAAETRSAGPAYGRPADRQRERRGLLKPEENDWSLTVASVFPTRGPDIGYSIRVHYRACWLNN